jgi:hypothetical protein
MQWRARLVDGAIVHQVERAARGDVDVVLMYAGQPKHFGQVREAVLGRPDAHGVELGLP